MYGFIKGRGTQTALFEFMFNLFRSMESRQRVLSIFYDLSNAFGTVCSPILLRKFELLGVRGLAQEWLRSALSGRSQCVKLRDLVDGKFEREVLSAFVPVNRGTPQGGIVSPFLFDIGIFDMVLCVIVGILLNYADDSSSLITASTNEILFREARIAAGMMATYCANNYLSLNGTKSVILYFRSARGRQPAANPYVPIDGKSVQCSGQTKFLGLHLTDTLSWKNHGSHVIDKLNTAVFMISSLKKQLDERHLLMVYYSFAYSFMQYGIVFWGCAKSVVRDVFVAQKRLVRALAGERYWPSVTGLCSARPLFERLELLPLFSIYLLEACKFVRHYPQYFRAVGDVHNHGTRRRADVFVDSHSPHSPYACMIAMYNALPNDVKSKRNYLKFVKALKLFVHSKRYYSIDEYLL